MTQKMIGIQAGAVSFVDEGVDAVLDIFQQNQINTIFLATFTYGRGIAGRQVPGQPLPDHGKREYDEKQFHGGNYATPHPKFYEKTSLKNLRAPDHGDADILEQVLARTKPRGMKVYCWYEDNFDRAPGVEPMQEIELSGRKAGDGFDAHGLRGDCSRGQERAEECAGGISHLARQLVLAVRAGRAGLRRVREGRRLSEDRSLQQLRRAALCEADRQLRFDDL